MPRFKPGPPEPRAAKQGPRSRYPGPIVLRSDVTAELGVWIDKTSKTWVSFGLQALHIL